MPEPDEQIAMEQLKARVDAMRPKYPEFEFKKFFEEAPPDSPAYIIDLASTSDGRGQDAPDLLLLCEAQQCAGPRLFRCGEHIYGEQFKFKYYFLTFTCRNCGTRVHRFAISFYLETAPTGKTPGRATCTKLGQIPAFGPPTPARLLTLIGLDREIFLQGRRAESRGMGIGAFAYYRRVVENQKNRIIVEIAKVATILGSTPEIDALFAAAVTETQFSKSIEMVKDAIPQSLLIKGHNPLTLLHTALSRGLHNPDMTDSHCLALAQSIRTVLADLSERISEALKNTKEVQDALSVLLATPNTPKTDAKTLQNGN